VENLRRDQKYTASALVDKGAEGKKCCQPQKTQRRSRGVQPTSLVRTSRPMDNHQGGIAAAKEAGARRTSMKREKKKSRERGKKVGVAGGNHLGLKEKKHLV